MTCKFILHIEVTSQIPLMKVQEVLYLLCIEIKIKCKVCKLYRNISSVECHTFYNLTNHNHDLSRHEFEKINNISNGATT